MRPHGRNPRVHPQRHTQTDPRHEGTRANEGRRAASSIPVTRSRLKPQVDGLGFVVVQANSAMPCPPRARSRQEQGHRTGHTRSPTRSDDRPSRDDEGGHQVGPGPAQGSADEERGRPVGAQQGLPGIRYRREGAVRRNGPVPLQGVAGPQRTSPGAGPVVPRPAPDPGGHVAPLAPDHRRGIGTGRRPYLRIDARRSTLPVGTACPPLEPRARREAPMDIDPPSPCRCLLGSR
jgi:hypothetical protein